MDTRIIEETMTKLHLEISIAEHLEVKPFWIDPAVMERIANVLKNKKEIKKSCKTEKK